MEEQRGIFLVPVQINGAITLGFVVDSGAADVQIPLDVFTTLVRANTIVPSDFVGEQTYVLADGSTQEEPRFVIRELKVGADIFQNVRASVSPASGSLLLGQSFLARFVEWSIDNQRRVLRLVEKSTIPPSEIPLSPNADSPPAQIATVTRVQKLELYRNDFFSELREVFGDQPGIRVVADRFIFQNETLFLVDSADLTPAGRLKIIELALSLEQIAKKTPPGLHWILEVQGYTDATPIRTAEFASNWELSAQRAVNIVHLLVEQGVPPDRLVAAGFGDAHPLDPTDTPAAYAENRRIELRFSSY